MLFLNNNNGAQVIIIDPHLTTKVNPSVDQIKFEWTRILDNRLHSSLVEFNGINKQIQAINTIFKTSYFH